MNRDLFTDFGFGLESVKRGVVAESGFGLKSVMEERGKEKGG